MQNYIENTAKAGERFDRLIAGFAKSALAARLMRIAREGERRGLLPSQKMIEMAEKAQ